MAKTSRNKPKGRGHVKRYIENKRQTLRNLGFNYRFKTKSAIASPEKISVRHSNNNDSIIIVSWSDITFSDGYLWVKHDGARYKVEDFNARKIFNNIKLLYESRLDPVKIRLSYHGAHIDDTIQYNEVVKFLKIHTSFIETHKLDLEELYSLGNKYSGLFIPYSKTEYFDYLCSIQDSKTVVVPVAEKCLSRPDSFLFTYKSVNDKAYIIWESIHSGLATYVFEVNSEEYDYSLRRIFDFVSSEITTKRIYLRTHKSYQYIIERGRPIEHTTISEWKYRLKAALHSL
jgi:hypothetical protein